MLTGEMKFGQEALAGVKAYSFGECTLEVAQRALLRNGKLLPLRPKAFDVLHCLVCHAGELLSRDALLEAVWPNLVVTDDSLTQCLLEIRKALGDDEKTIIRTIPRRGYRLEAPVEVHGAAGETRIFSSQPRHQSSVESNRPPSRWTLAGFLVLALALVAIWWRYEIDPLAVDGQMESEGPHPGSIAVLPFADLSEAGDQEYLAEGISEEILNILAQSPNLTVIARTSSFSFKDSRADIRTIASELGVAHVLEGSVRKAGDQVRVTVQLVDGETEAHIWSQTYDDRLNDIFAMQDRIARSVAEVLKVELTVEMKEAGAGTEFTPDPRAWEAYMRGRLFYSRRGEGDITRAQDSFEQAIELDPGFADPWVSLAGTYRLRQTDVNVAEDVRLAGDIAQPLMRDALENALALEPDHPEALWRYSLLTWLDGDIDKTLAQLESAIRLGGNVAIVQAMAGGFMWDTGNQELAIPYFARAITLDPLSAAHRQAYGHILYFNGLLEEAEDVLEQAVALNPDWGEDVDELLTWIYILRNETGKADALVQAMPDGPARDQAVAILGHLQGDRFASDAALQRLLAMPAEQVSERLAFVYAMRGEADEAFSWLFRARDKFAQGVTGDHVGRGRFNTFLRSPFLNSLKKDARWMPWFSETRQLFLEEVDYLVVDMLREHLNDNPRLYPAYRPMTD